MDRATPSFYWYDLETTGLDPKGYGRIAQFAGQRTDWNLNAIGEPLVLYLRLSDEILPHPDASLVTGITPQHLEERGESYWAGISRIYREFNVPNTCVVGYNNLEYDDEFIRYSFYRNLLNPYAWHWRQRNSRTDLLNIVRLAAALRPEGIEWPRDEETGAIGFSLEALARENGFENEDAHEALSDVETTITLARHVRQAQPRLWDYVLDNRSRFKVEKYLRDFMGTPFLHVSATYSNARCGTAPLLSVAERPGQKGRYIAVDLAGDMSLLESGTPEEIREVLFTKQSELPEGTARPPLSLVASNRSPVIAPMNTVDASAESRLGFSVGEVTEVAAHLATIEDLPSRVAAVYESDYDFAPATNAEEALYDRFLDENDLYEAELIHEALESGEPWPDVTFRDRRFWDLSERLRARERWGELTDEEQAEHVQFIRQHLFGEQQNLRSYLEDLDTRLSTTTNDRDRQILSDLKSYGHELDGRYGSDE